MTALLPPNLLKLFAPRPPVPYLKPLTRDEKVRGPNKLVGVAPLRQRLKEEADDDEIKQGLADKPVTLESGEIVAEAGKAEASGSGMVVDKEESLAPEVEAEAEPVDYYGMKVAELKEELTKRGLDTKGLKKDVSYQLRSCLAIRKLTDQLLTRLNEEVEKEAAEKAAKQKVKIEKAEKEAKAAKAKQAKQASATASTSAPVPSKNKKGKERKIIKPKNDKIAKMGVVGQEARKMRLEERIKRREQYKKDSEANCERYFARAVCRAIS